MQIETGQSRAIAASDSSDKSKEKVLDQKVHFSLFSLRRGELMFLSYFRFAYHHFLQTLRRLAQNREAARKSRLRKKVNLSSLILHTSLSF